MRHRLLAMLLLACAGTAPGTLIAQPQGGENTMMSMHGGPVIVTSAQGESRVTPDRATILIGVQTQGRTAAQASAENARKQKAVIAALVAKGIGADQISTTEYNVYPQQTFEPNKGDTAPRIVGYNVTNTVRVEVRKVDHVGELIDAALGNGANTINSLDFFASNQDQARREALARAVQRARGDAQALAEAAGGRLGDLLELSAGPQYTPPRPVQFRAAVAETATPISPGEETLSVTVSARWRYLAPK